MKIHPHPHHYEHITTYVEEEGEGIGDGSVCMNDIFGSCGSWGVAGLWIR